MIDLHTHVLPGLDDGARSTEDSLALARAAAAGGTTVLVATPHVREDHPFDLGRIRPMVEELNACFRSELVPVAVAPGGEVAITRLIEAEPAELAQAQLGQGPYILVESPYTTAGDLLEHALFEAQLKGFRPILAHPERSPCFLDGFGRLAQLVERGILCSVTSGSMAGRFGGTVRDYTLCLFERGLVHNVASESHGALNRPPDLLTGFENLEEGLPGIRAQAGWYTENVPAAVLAGTNIPGPPPGLIRRRKRRSNFGGVFRWNTRN